jgi:hypothetical protein
MADSVLSTMSSLFVPRADTHRTHEQEATFSAFNAETKQVEALSFEQEDFARIKKRFKEWGIWNRHQMSPAAGCPSNWAEFGKQLFAQPSNWDNNLIEFSNQPWKTGMPKRYGRRVGLSGLIYSTPLKLLTLKKKKLVSYCSISDFILPNPRSEHVKDSEEVALDELLDSQPVEGTIRLFNHVERRICMPISAFFF